MNLRASLFVEAAMSAPREIKLASVRSLRPDKRNARTHSKKQNSADRKEHPTLRLDLSDSRR